MVKVLSIHEKIQNIKKFLNKDNINGPIIGFQKRDSFPIKSHEHASNLIGIKDLKPNDIDINGLLLDHHQMYKENINMYGNSYFVFL